MSSHGAKRRRLQYVGKIMRDVDAEPIRAALAAIRGRPWKWRGCTASNACARLLEDEKTLADIAEAFPAGRPCSICAHCDRSAKEQEAQKPPRSYRTLFQELKALETGAAVEAEDADDND